VGSVFTRFTASPQAILVMLLTYRVFRPTRHPNFGGNENEY